MTATRIPYIENRYWAVRDPDNAVQRKGYRAAYDAGDVVHVEHKGRWLFNTEKALQEAIDADLANAPLPATYVIFRLY